LKSKKIPFFFLSLLILVNYGCSLKKIRPVYPLFEYSYLDTSCLKGKTFIIDPGHGGNFTGAEGRIGITESEVNLGVGLYLWGMLKQGGANAYLTRKANIDFITDYKKPLKADLNFRLNLCKKFGADYFISIHHNSNTRNRRKNLTEIYYKMADPGPSYELARSIATYFKNYFFVKDVRVLPGNYHVLRENTIPAIIGEAAYLSNLSSEKNLSLQGYIRKEAEIYFLGILDYLHKKVPKIFDLSPTSVVQEAQPEICAYIQDEDGKGTIDPKSILFYLDDSQVPAKYHPESGRVSYIPPQPLKNGKHFFKIYGKNLHKNSAFPQMATFTVSLPPKSIEVKPEFSLLPPLDGAFTGVSFLVKDKNFMPVIDGTEIALKSSSGKLKPEKVYTKDGYAFSYFYPLIKEGKAVITASCKEIYAKIHVNIIKSQKSYIVVKIIGHQDRPLNKTEIILETGKRAYSDKNGFIFFCEDCQKTYKAKILKFGYYPYEIELSFNPDKFKKEIIKLQPKEEGLLLNKKISLDFAIKEKNFDSKLRLLVSELKTLLKEAGVSVFLSCESASDNNIKQRIIRINKTSSCICLSLSYEGKSRKIGYYYKSIKGEKLGSHISNSIKEVKGIDISVTDSTKSIILFTSMPTITINFPWRNSPKEDAMAIYKGIVEFFKEEKFEE
jgi:N-acetylmuramoyl-L-alanine amidase